MKKFFYAFVLLVAMAFTGTISAHAATYKVYKADAVSYQSGQYQIRCNAITPAVSDWSWLNNGIPVNKVNWVDASGKILQMVLTAILKRECTSQLTQQ